MLRYLLIALIAALRLVANLWRRKAGSKPVLRLRHVGRDHSRICYSYVDGQ